MQIFNLKVIKTTFIFISSINCDTQFFHFPTNSETMEPKLVLVYERLVTIGMPIIGSDSSTHKTALQAEWSELLSAWAEENSSWLPSFGLGKSSKLSSK